MYSGTKDFQIRICNCRIRFRSFIKLQHEISCALRALSFFKLPPTEQISKFAPLCPCNPVVDISEFKGILHWERLGEQEDSYSTMVLILDGKSELRAQRTQGAISGA